jgi:hypothetical protein
VLETQSFRRIDTGEVQRVGEPLDATEMGSIEEPMEEEAAGVGRDVRAMERREDLDVAVCTHEGERVQSTAQARGLDPLRTLFRSSGVHRWF